MLRREHVVNKLRELGFKYATTTDRTYLYKRGTDRVFLPKRDQIPEEWVRQTFRQLGVPKDEIERFVSQSHC